MIHEATRTLVKSPPEIWEQCSDPESLSRHLNGSFGEIRITRLEPESTVAWEGKHASGTVTIEPSAWGTRVTLTAETESEEVEVEREPDVGEDGEPDPELVGEDELDPEPEPEPAPLGPAEPQPPGWQRERFSRLLVRFWRGRAGSAPLPRSSAPALDEPGVSTPAPLTPAAQAARAWPEADHTEPWPEADHAEPVEVAEAPAEVALQPTAHAPDQPSSEEEGILTAALESLGQAHHRPYSRS
jgi:hypothetical protein